MSKGPKWNDVTQNTITVWIWEKGINIYVKLIGKQTSFCLEIELIISGLGLMHHPNIHSGCSFSFVFQELFLNLISNSSIHSGNTKLNLIVLHVVGLVQEIWCPGFYSSLKLIESCCTSGEFCWVCHNKSILKCKFAFCMNKSTSKTTIITTNTTGNRISGMGNHLLPLINRGLCSRVARVCYTKIEIVLQLIKKGKIF